MKDKEAKVQKSPSSFQSEYSSLFFTLSESKSFQEHLAIPPHFLRTASWIKLFASYKSQTCRYHPLKPTHKSPPSKGKPLVQFAENNIKCKRSVETKIRWLTHNNQGIFSNRGRHVRAPSMLEVDLKVVCCEGERREGALVPCASGPASLPGSRSDVENFVQRRGTMIYKRLLSTRR